MSSGNGHRYSFVPHRVAPFARGSSPNAPRSGRNTISVSHPHSATTSKFKPESYALPQRRDDTDIHLDSEDSDFAWEEEDTLFSDLIEEPARKPKEERVNDLLDSLQPYFTQLGNDHRRGIANTLVPTVNFIKGVFRHLDEDMDPAYAHGIRAFDNVSADMEKILEHELKDFQQTHAKTLETIASLFQELEEAYAAHNRLWDQFEADIKAVVEPAQERLKHHPIAVERCIARLNAQAKPLEKDEDVKTLLAELFSGR